MKILIVGAGNMGVPLSKSIAKGSHLEDEIFLYDKDFKRVEFAIQNSKIKACRYLADILPSTDLIFLAIKPNHASDFFEEIKSGLRSSQIFVSIMAGVSLDKLAEGLHTQKLIRLMPNLASTIGSGMTTFIKSDAVSDSEISKIKNLLWDMGTLMEVDSERKIDASTSISGTGPAYVFYFMKALVEAGKELGFDTKESRILVSKTFEGAIKLYNQSDISLDTWIDRVASKGGTTEAAINFMNQQEMDLKIKEAAKKAFERALELNVQ